MTTKKTLILVTLALLMASCVPPRQYAELQEKQITCSHNLDSLQSVSEVLTVENTELKAKLDRCQNGIKKLSEDSLTRNEALVKMNIEYKNLLERYQKLKEAQDELKRGSASSTQKLLTDLQRTQTDLQSKEDALRKTEREIDTKARNMLEMQKKMEAQNLRLLEMERILSRKDSATKALRAKVSEALLGFEGQGLTVTHRDGKVYVSLDEKLLFNSGSAEIGPNGTQALRQLAKVLEQSPDINIMIEGHTDDVPYISKGSPIKDNWDLSVKRATEVVRIILANSKIDPTRLTASGKGEFMPLDKAKTNDARAKNRRTEIILTPKLDELYKLINEN